MSGRLGLTPRISLVFVLFAAALLAAVGLLSYRSGSGSLQAAAVSELLATAIGKEALLDEWVAEQVVDLEIIAASPMLRDTLAERLTAAAGSSRARLAQGRLVAELKPRVLAMPDSHLLLAVLDPASGMVVAATDSRLEGQAALDEAYFRNAQHGSYVQYPYRSELLHGTAMTIGTPLRSAQGPLLGVLVAWLDVAEIGAIVQQRSGLHSSDESYLVNPAGQFVTQPRLLGRPAVLETHPSSEALRECLAGNSGVSFAVDYRGVPTIAFYRWLPKHRLGLISKIDLAEALAPARAFGRTILLVSSLALLVASALALGLARSITHPVRALQAGVARFERGELDVRLAVTSRDVLGKLAGEFNNMAATIAEKERQLRLNAQELEAKVAARTGELRASEERMRSILASAQEAFIGMDAAGLISDWNPQAEATFGWSSREALGRPMHQLIIPPRFRERHLQGLRHFLASGEGPLLNKRIELLALHRDGHELPVELTISPVRLGDSVMFGAFLHDISERRRVADELQRAKDAAEAASRVKSEFLANMSHEIRTPMNGVLGTVGLLLESELSAEQRELAELARASGESLLGIIDDILDFSKVEAGKLRLEPLPFDLLLAVEDIAGMSAAKAQAKDLDVIVRYPAQVPRHVIGDPGRIRQVLANLSNNAIKFTERGQVLIDVEALTQSEAEVALRISIQDSGIGIPADKLEQLFEKFTQADSSTTRRYGGTGLGLAISKQLVELMGGRIGALSRPGEGSTFWFTLRLPRQPASPERVPATGDLSGARVLIVDDNALNRRVLHEQLANWRVRDGACASGAEALRVLREAQAAGDPYGLAILDYQMPDMDGEMLGRAIKADPALSDTLLLMLTSLGHRGDAERFKTIGFVAYLGKPVRQADLFEALVELWTAHTQQRPGAIVTRHSLAEARAQQGGRVQARPRFDARVLLVEDNLTNQQVAALMLRNLGCRVDVAGNGREALRMLQATAYDLLFMDCEMPEMDGFEAAAAIRRRGDGKAQTPIVAVTAQAMQGDRERCLRAGMNDYIRKPVQLEAFAAALKRWAPNRLGQGHDGAIPDERRATAGGLAALSLAGSGWSGALDVEVIGDLRDLAAATDHDLLQQIFQSFLHDGVERIRAMRAALDAGEAEALRQAAHTLSGACRSVGARRMAPITQQIEALGSSGTLIGALSLIEQLDEAFAQVAAAIGELGVGNEQQGEHSS